MEMSVRSLVRWAKGVPFVGSFVAFLIALYRLPLLYRRLAYLDERLTQLEVRLGVPGHATDALATNDDIKNLIVSTPVALRKLRRDLDLILRHSQLEVTDPRAAISKESNE